MGLICPDHVCVYAVRLLFLWIGFVLINFRYTDVY